MAGETVITIIGNLTADPEPRYTPSGAMVVDFTVANTARVFDRETGQMKDGDTLFMRCSAWNDLAENISESLRKGMRVIVTGSLRQRSYEDRNGQQRTVVELRVDEVGPSLRWARAQVTRNERSASAGPRGGGYQGSRGGQPQGGSYGGSNQAGYGAPAGGTVDDPWRASSQDDVAFGEPPF